MCIGNRFFWTGCGCYTGFELVTEPCLSLVFCDSVTWIPQLESVGYCPLHLGLPLPAVLPACTPANTIASLTCPNFSNHLYGVTTPFSGPASIPATPFELGTTSGTDTSGNNRDRHDSTDFHPLGSQEIDWDKHFDFGPDGEAENGPDEGITSGIDTSRNNRDRHDSIDFHPLGSQEIDWDEHFDFGPDGEAENGPDEEAENGPNIGTENDQEYPEVGPLFTEGEEQAELPVTESIALRSEITSWENHDMSPWHPMITRSKTRAAQKAPEIGQNGKGA